MIDKERLWQAVKHYFSDKVKSSDKITLVHEDRVLTIDDENANILNSFFHSIIKHMKISEFKCIHFSAEWIPHLEIMKLLNHRIRKDLTQKLQFFKTKCQWILDGN